MELHLSAKKKKSFLLYNDFETKNSGLFPSHQKVKIEKVSSNVFCIHYEYKVFWKTYETLIKMIHMKENNSQKLYRSCFLHNVIKLIIKLGNF